MICPWWLSTTHSFISAPTLCCHCLSIWCLPCAINLFDSTLWQWPKGWAKQALPASPLCNAEQACKWPSPTLRLHTGECSASFEEAGIAMLLTRVKGDTWYDAYRSPQKMRTALQLTMCCFCQVWCVLVMWKRYRGWWEVSGIFMEDSGWSGLSQVAAGHFYPFLRDFPLPSPSFTTTTQLLCAELQQT